MPDKFPAPSELRKLSIHELQALVERTIGASAQDRPEKAVLLRSQHDKTPAIDGPNRLTVMTLAAEVTGRLEASNDKGQTEALTKMQELLSQWFITQDRRLRRDEGDDSPGGRSRSCCMCSLRTEGSDSEQPTS
jgi:hypothetical protein